MILSAKAQLKTKSMFRKKCTLSVKKNVIIEYTCNRICSGRLYVLVEVVAELYHTITSGPLHTKRNVRRLDLLNAMGFLPLRWTH